DAITLTELLLEQSPQPQPLRLEPPPILLGRPILTSGRVAELVVSLCPGPHSCRKVGGQSDGLRLRVAVQTAILPMHPKRGVPAIGGPELEQRPAPLNQFREQGRPLPPPAIQQLADATKVLDFAETSNFQEP